MADVWKCDTCARYQDSNDQRLTLRFDGFDQVEQDDGKVLVFVVHETVDFCSWSCLATYAVRRAPQQHPANPGPEQRHSSAASVVEMRAVYRYTRGWENLSDLAASWDRFNAGISAARGDWEFLVALPADQTAEYVERLGQRDPSAMLMTRRATPTEELLHAPLPQPDQSTDATPRQPGDAAESE